MNGKEFIGAALKGVGGEVGKKVATGAISGVSVSGIVWGLHSWGVTLRETVEVPLWGGCAACVSVAVSGVCVVHVVQNRWGYGEDFFEGFIWRWKGGGWWGAVRNLDAFCPLDEQRVCWQHEYQGYDYFTVAKCERCGYRGLDTRGTHRASWIKQRIERRIEREWNDGAWKERTKRVAEGKKACRGNNDEDSKGRGKRGNEGDR